MYWHTFLKMIYNKFIINQMETMNIMLNEYSIYNKDFLQQHKLCVCMDCLSEFDVNKILNWTDNQRTAICPYCWNDTLVVSTKYTNIYTDNDIYNYKYTYIQTQGRYNTITFREDDGQVLPEYI